MDKTLDLLIAALQDVRTKANTGNSNQATLTTQPGGIFSIRGMDRTVISTHIVPQGIGSLLPAFPSQLDDPRFGFITGYAAEVGSEPTYPCDDAPKGYMQGGLLTAAFGSITRETQTIEISKLLHQTRGINTNLMLMGEMLGMTRDEIGSSNPLDLVVKSEMIGVGVNMERKLSKTAWQGLPSRNTVGGGYKEFPGLDSQIATGQIDAETSTAMAAADSLVMDFNYSRVDGTSKDIMEYLSMGEYYMYNKLERLGMLPASYVVAMRPELWAELSAVWPCRYLTNRCANASGTNVMVINDDTNIQMRNMMRNNMTIEINGRTYPVVTDDGIFEKTNITGPSSITAGSYASAIAFVPLRVRGNFPVTYWEYINYKLMSPEMAALGGGARNIPFWTDGGKLLWVYRPNGYCFDLQAKSESRIVLRTPHLAFKLNNVLYTPMQHLASPYPESPYWSAGGVSLRTNSTSRAVWA
jgi:hypothetical protein